LIKRNATILKNRKSAHNVGRVAKSEDVSSSRYCVKMGKIAELIKSEIVKVVGCTEPAAIAYAFSSIVNFCGLKPEVKKVQVRLYLSEDVFRNASTAGLPGMKEKGVDVAAAMGIFSAHSDLNVFANPKKSQLVKAGKLLERRNWLKISILSRRGIFIRAELKSNGKIYQSIISKRHNNLESISINGKKVFKGNKKTLVEIKSIKQIWDIVKKGDKTLEKIAEEFILANSRIRRKAGRKCVSNDVFNLVKRRMEGEYIKIMTIVGSGNHGIFLSLPFYQLYGKAGRRVIPSVLFSILTVIYMTRKKGRLSAYCGLAEKASPALLAGLLYLKGKRLSEIMSAMKMLEESTVDILCDGAKESCAGKAHVCLRNVFKVCDIRNEGLC